MSELREQVRERYAVAASVVIEGQLAPLLTGSRAPG